MTDLIYIASPYTGTNEQMSHRYWDVCKYTAILMNKGLHVFSPISHSHGPAQHGLPKDFAYWRDYCILMLEKCDSMHVLMLDGWATSKGVTAEIGIAADMKMDISYVAPELLLEKVDVG